MCSDRRFNHHKFVFLLLAFFTLTLPVIAQTSEQFELPSSELAENEFRFAVLGDAGTGKKHQKKVAKQMLNIQRQTNFKLILFLGDNVYENGSPKDIQKKFLEPYADLFRRGVEFRGAIGNHDARSPHGLILQQLIFGMGHKTYYSFTKKDDLIEFFGIDSTMLVKKKKAFESTMQINWLDKQLEKSNARWKVAFLHHPIYSSAKKHGETSADKDELFRVREYLEPIYQKHNLQISLNGHDHVYERTKRIGGVHYFTSGAGGKLRINDLDKTTDFFAFGNDLVHSFMLFSVKADVVTFWSIGSDGTILDSGQIKHLIKSKKVRSEVK